MLKIAFQGERGAFSEQAIHQLLRRPVELVPRESFEQAFAAVAKRQATGCVVPIENTLAGSIYKNFDLLQRYQFRILGETNVRVEHHLIGPKTMRLRDIKQVISHPVALEQCQKFLRGRRYKVTAGYDTAGCVKQLAEHPQAGVAAIAGSLAARLYGCQILKRNIEDHRQNFTRFWLVAPPRRQGGLTGFSAARGNKTSIVFSTRNTPGALFNCLGVFAARHINLSKIESRPLVGRPFEYLFYIDFLGNPEEQRCGNALQQLAEFTDFLRVLGCYRKA